MALSAETKVGIMMVVVLVLIVVLVFGVGGMDLFAGGKEIKVMFDSTSGVAAGSAVELAGVSCGTVKDISFMDIVEDGKPKTLVVATLKVKDTTQIHADSQIYISSSGMLGEKYVNITTGTPGSALAPANMVFRGTDLSDISILITKVNQLAEGLQLSLKGINEILDPETIKDVKGTMASLNVFTASLEKSSGDLTASLASLRSISSSVDKGEGTLGKLIKHSEIYDDLRLTIADLQSLIKDIKEHPGKYINISVF